MGSSRPAAALRCLRRKNAAKPRLPGLHDYLWKGSEKSKTKAPPFDDVYEWVATYTVEPGYHWIAISTGWADGPSVNDCSDFHERSRQYFDPEPVRVELTVEIDPSECKAAKTALKKRQKAVANLRRSCARPRRPRRSAS